MKTKTFRVLMVVKSFRLAIILFAILAGHAVPANAAPITEEVKQRARADLGDACLNLFINTNSRRLPALANSVFVLASLNPFGEFNSHQFCGWGEGKAIWDSWEDAERKAIATCEARRPQGGSPCEVYARNSDIVYVSIHDRLKAAKKLFESEDIPAAERALNDIKARNLSALSDAEKGEYEYLFGKVLANSKTEQGRTDAIRYIHSAWFNHPPNVNAAVEEGNLRMRKVALIKIGSPFAMPINTFLRMHRMSKSRCIQKQSKT